MKRHSNVIGIFLMAAVLFTVSLCVMYFVGLRDIACLDRVAAQRAILQNLQLTLSTLKDAETGQRGYLLTGNAQYLQPYREAIKQTNSELAALERLASLGDLPADSVQAVFNLAQDKFAELEQAIHLRESQGLPAALPLVNSGTDRATMSKIRALIAEMSAAKERELQQTLTQAHQDEILRLWTYGLAIVFNLTVLAWASRRIHSEMRGREAASLEIARQKELLATTLASIGDGVIVTDEQGRATFLNSEAERLTGWNNSEALGHPLPEIFRIVNEHTRKTVDNPVEKVLRLGKMVELANHTILIAKDGSETPIDDSAAPIRAPGGPLSGVVLVFRDFTKHKEAENQLRARTDEMERLLDLLPAAVWIATKTDCQEIRSNRFAAELLGLPKEKNVSQSSAAAVPIPLYSGGRKLHPDELPMQRAAATGAPQLEYELDVHLPNGRQLTIFGGAIPIKNDDGTVRTVIAAFTDLTGRKEAERKLRASEERYRLLVSIIADVPWTADPCGGFVTPQSAWQKYTGQSEKEFWGFGWLDAIHDHDRIVVEEMWKRACHKRTLFEAQGRLWHAATRQHRHFQARAVPLFGDDGAVREWIGTFMDVHEKKLAVDALREAQRKLVRYAADLERRVEGT